MTPKTMLVIEIIELPNDPVYGWRWHLKRGGDVLEKGYTIRCEAARRACLTHAVEFTLGDFRIDFFEGGHRWSEAFKMRKGGAA